MTRRIILFAVGAWAILASPHVTRSVSATATQPPLPDLVGDMGASARSPPRSSTFPSWESCLRRPMPVTLLRVRPRLGRTLLSTKRCAAWQTKAPTSLVKHDLSPGCLRTKRFPAIERRGRLEWQKGRVRYVEPKQTFWRGMRPEVRHRGAAMPTGPDDPRIGDLDGDGQPGLTVEVGGLIEGQHVPGSAQLERAQRGRTIS